MQSRTWFIFILSVTLLIITFSSPVSAGLEQQRQDFLAAEKALKNNRLIEYNQLLSKLKGYPLYPYLIYQQICNNISLQQEERILWFLNEYNTTPLANNLRQRWLQYLAENDQWERLIRDYQNPSSEVLQCSYARALMETGRTAQAWEEAGKLWLSGRSRPKECNPVFDGWRSRGLLTTEMGWQRIELAIAQGQITLARYLRNYLPVEEQDWLDLWLDVLSRPSRILEINWSGKSHPVQEKILVQGMGRLIREDTQKALKQWKKLEGKLNPESLNTAPVKQELALYLALRNHPEAIDYINSLSVDTVTSSVREWHVRKALYLQDWQEALSALEKLDDLQKNSPRWTYWRGRVLEEIGLVHEAKAVYQSIIGRQNYFSLLAADRMNQSYLFEHRAISSLGPDILTVKNDPGILRALELFHLERMLEARREWNFALSGKTTREIKAAALLAHDRGWHDRAIVAAADAREFNDLIVRFPITYSELINNYSTARDLDPAWVFALARQESMFMADVGSPAGALGIMQIMPATGRLIASSMGENFRSSNVLLSPETNIRFGTFYLKKRLDELQANPVLATAAYNAGVQRVRTWLPDEGSIPTDIWVENIPFFETRDYVEKVFTYKAIYQNRLGVKPVSISSFMPDILGKNIILVKDELN